MKDPTFSMNEPKYCEYCCKLLRVTDESVVKYNKYTGEPVEKKRQRYKCPDFQLILDPFHTNEVWVPEKMGFYRFE